MFDKNNEETDIVANVTWLDASVSAKPVGCRIREAMSRLAYLSFLIGFGKYSDGSAHKLQLVQTNLIHVHTYVYIHVGAAISLTHTVHVGPVLKLVRTIF